MRNLILTAVTPLLAVAMLAPKGLAQEVRDTTVKTTKPARALIVGRAVDENGKPLKAVGAVVGRKETVLTKDALAAAKPLKDGRFRIQLPVVDPREERPQPGVLIAAKGRQSMFMMHVPYAGHPGYDNARIDIGNLALLRGTTVSGQVRDKAGKPLAGVRVTSKDLCYGYVRVNLYGQLSHHGVTVTDADGRFRMRCVPGNALKLTFQKPGYYRSEQQPISQTTPINVQLEASGFVEGQARDRSGNGLKTALEIIYEADVPPAPIYTPPDGRFKVNVECRGRYRVGRRARADLGRSALLSPILTGPQNNLLVQPLAGERDGPGGCFLNFIVTDKDAKPVRGVEAWFYTGYPDSYHPGFMLLHKPPVCVKVDASGVVHLQSRRDNGQVILHAKGLAPAHVRYRGDGSQARPEVVKAKMVPESAIEGRVVDSAGKALAGAKVWAIWLAAKNSSIGYGHVPPSAVTTDRGGRFRLENLTTGSHAVQAMLQGHGVPLASNVTLDAGETKRGVSIEIPRGFKLKGTIKGARSGWSVQLRVNSPKMPSGAHFSGGQSFMPQTPGVDGSFQFAGLQFGSSYTLSLLQPCHDRFRKPLRFELGQIPSVSKDQTVSFDAARFRTGTIHGSVRVIGAKGMAERLVVTAVANVDGETRALQYQMAQERSRSALVDLAGRYRLQVAPGKYHIRVYDLGSQIEVAALEETFEVAGDTTIKRELTIATHPVRLQLKNTTGQPILVGNRIAITPKARRRRRGFNYTSLRYYLGFLRAYPGIPVRPGQKEILFHARPGEYAVKVMDRSACLRSTSSFRATDLGSKAIKVEANGKNEFVIQLKPPPTAKELNGK